MRQTAKATKLCVAIAYYVVFTLLIKVLPHENRSNSHSHIRVHLYHAVLPSRRRLLSSEEYVVERLLGFLKTVVQIVHSMPDETPEQIISYCSENVIQTSAVDSDGIIKGISFSPGRSVRQKLHKVLEILGGKYDHRLGKINSTREYYTQISVPINQRYHLVQLQQRHLLVQIRDVVPLVGRYRDLSIEKIVMHT